MGNSHPNGTYPGHTGRITCIDSSTPNFGEKILITGSEDKTIRLWSVKHGGCITSLGHTTGVTSLAYPCVETLHLHSAPITAMCNVTTGAKTNQVVSASADGIIHVWKDVSAGMFSTDRARFAIQKTLEWNVPVASLGEHRSTDKNILCAGTVNGRVVAWDANTWQFLNQIGEEGEHSAHVAQASSTMSSKNHITAVGYADHSVRVWDIRTGEYVEGHNAIELTPSEKIDSEHEAQDHSYTEEYPRRETTEALLAGDVDAAGGSEQLLKAV
eukprot:gene30652-37901_t